jgi:uncharacterized membrane protein YukC
MLTTVKLVQALINSEHGWAVAGQFEDTFNGKSFEEQNYNALMYIRETLDKLLNSDLLSEDTQDELQTYRDELEDYITGGGDDNNSQDEEDDDDEDHLSSVIFGVDNKQ